MLRRTPQTIFKSPETIDTVADGWPNSTRFRSRINEVWVQNGRFSHWLIYQSGKHDWMLLLSLSRRRMPRWATRKYWEQPVSSNQMRTNTASVWRSSKTYNRWFAMGASNLAIWCKNMGINPSKRAVSTARTLVRPLKIGHGKTNNASKVNK